MELSSGQCCFIKKCRNFKVFHPSSLIFHWSRTNWFFPKNLFLEGLLNYTMAFWAFCSVERKECVKCQCRVWASEHIWCRTLNDVQLWSKCTSRDLNLHPLHGKIRPRPLPQAPWPLRKPVYLSSSLLLLGKKSARLIHLGGGTHNKDKNLQRPW